MENALRKSICGAAILVWIVCSAGIVSAQETAVDDRWEFFGELYFWGASVDGKSADGSDVDADFDDIIGDVNFAFMGAAGVSKGKWSLGADLIYVNIEDSGDIAPGVSANVELTNWVITPLVGYRVADTEKSRLDIVGGARYLYLDADLRVDALGARVDESGSNWDAVIGARGSVDLAKKWYLFGYLDIGTGESDLTWQALGGIGYRFKYVDLVGAYRYLSWEFDDDQALEEQQLHGPGVGIRFAF
ncbi:MAG: hypothetical protein ABF303_15965 [Desulfobacterales bacterium]